ncbi:hypothetical protein N0V82_010712 [Gnomoniopsis sp. IMI 355080]|nr:hypothetical protein N0V82_010712 [Gnomoniopsis sp. IMI 355080]
MFGFHSFARCLLAASLVRAAPSRFLGAGSPDSQLDVEKRDTATATDRLVFCHFMVGIVSDRTSAADYDSDMQLAKELGIDAFALNIGTDDFTDEQLGYAYESAANNDMKVFISFDFNWFDPTTDADTVGQTIAKYAGKSAQLLIDGSAFASSFAGDGLDVSAVRTAAATDVFFAPNFHPAETSDPSAQVDAALNWMGWTSNGDNKAPKPGGTNVTVGEGDVKYREWLSTRSDSSLAKRSTSKYIAPVSPWFSTHYGAEVSYSKNFVFPSDLLWFERWNQILTLAPQYVEIITWNDYGESHYVGPLSSPHYDDGASKWVNDMPHDGFRDMAKPFIAAYKAGATSVDDYITDDQLIYWYRPTTSDAECDSTDNTMAPAANDSGNYFHGKPDGYEDLEDAVFLIAMLTADGTVTINSGGTTTTFDGVAGANAFQVPMGVGQQSFSLTRDSKTVLSGTSLKDIQDQCVCGIYNFNAYVGTLPAGTADPLAADGLLSFTVGLTATCSATPSLGTPTNVAASTTDVSSVAATSASQATSTAAAPTTTTASSSMTTASPSQAQYTSTASSMTIVYATTTLYTTVAPSGSQPTSSQTQASAASASASAAADCNAGTVADGQSGNLSGLCDFACSHGYCPETYCTCTSTGTAQTYSAGDAVTGCAIAGEEAIYDDLCAYTCTLGYCPDAACTTSC